MEEQRARQERELRENTGTTVGESGALSAGMFFFLFFFYYYLWFKL